MIAKVTIKRKSSGTLERLAKATEGRDQVAVGFFNSAMVLRAAVNEFGSKGEHVPERPFMRNAIRDNLGKYQTMFADGARAILRGVKTKEQVLEEVGKVAAQDIRKEIHALMTPPNSPETIRTKGSANPLVESGKMADAVEHKLR